jgi:hypothetical protein
MVSVRGSAESGEFQAIAGGRAASSIRQREKSMQRLAIDLSYSPA